MQYSIGEIVSFFLIYAQSRSSKIKCVARRKALCTFFHVLMYSYLTNHLKSTKVMTTVHLFTLFAVQLSGLPRSSKFYRYRVRHFLHNSYRRIYFLIRNSITDIACCVVVGSLCQSVAGRGLVSGSRRNLVPKGGWSEAELWRSLPTTLCLPIERKKPTQKGRLHPP